MTRCCFRSLVFAITDSSRGSFNSGTAAEISSGVLVLIERESTLESTLISGFFFICSLLPEQARSMKIVEATISGYLILISDSLYNIFIIIRAGVNHLRCIARVRFERVPYRKAVIPFDIIAKAMFVRK